MTIYVCVFLCSWNDTMTVKNDFFWSNIHWSQKILGVVKSHGPFRYPEWRFEIIEPPPICPTGENIGLEL